MRRRLAQEGQQGGSISAAIPIGSLVKGSVADVKPYGLVCDLDPDPDVVGFVAVHQQVGPGFGKVTACQALLLRTRTCWAKATCGSAATRCPCKITGICIAFYFADASASESADA